jgi:bacterial leucyl aminopeptidase
LVEGGFVPKRPLEFHFYSAEEGGLLGSQKIASKYMKEGRKVFGVLHNDMTGYQPKGKTPVIGISTDNIDESLTNTLRMLSDAYSGIGWKNTKCGYACSDHASWTKAGVPSCFTFEAEFENQSPYIHSTGDTVETLSFEHMSAFVNNVLGFAVEMSLF